MTRYKRTSGIHHSTPRAHLARIYAHTPPKSRNPRHKRRVHLQQNNDMKRDREDDLEDTYRSLLYGENGARDGNNGSSDEDDADHRSDDSEWDDEATLVETLGSPEYNQEEIFHALKQAFAGASHDLDEDIILALLPVLNQGRNARPAPGGEFITGLLGFDDVCKRFEKGSYRSAGFDAAYAKIEEETRELFEQLQAAYTRMEERRVVFQQQVKEHTNNMREIISTLPADVDALIAKLEKTYIDTSTDQGRVVKGKGRKRTTQGALAELQL
ncbi:hypothetical protein EDB92DRAFT_207816 [Lactarius akahatsu]|uniref:Uncharacterized protein n=1 Tax=Lactarius akahatsu TaxID=416441 RepID=A0AAD4QFF2_9AGAM|nr:hypothetical protein EDB92DRAFT_207816 [Lactarius akahatsu]